MADAKTEEYLTLSGYVEFQNEHSRLIQLTKGKCALVDPEDFDELSRYKWQYNGGYARRTWRENGEGRQIYMHRQITAADNGLEVDHINGNRLDNRRSNLRVVSHSQNAMNVPLSSKNRSGHTGVWWSPKRERWIAYIYDGGKRRTLGYFKDKESAIATRQAAEKRIYGEFSRRVDDMVVGTDKPHLSLQAYVEHLLEQGPSKENH